MTENLQIALLSIILTVMTSILGWIANTLAGMRKDLNRKVDKQDCDRDMDRHCGKLNALEERVQQNSVELAALRALVK